VPIVKFTYMFSYIIRTALTNLGGTPYRPRSWNRSSWCTVSNALTRSIKSAHVGWLWYLLVVSAVRSVNRPSRHPTPGCDPNCVFTPWSCITLASRALSIPLINRALISLRQIARQLFGSVASPFLCRHFKVASCHSGGLVFPL
jgi:hypothetical protein